MSETAPTTESGFRVFGLDRQVYGPVTTTALVEWARDGRVLRDTWIHSDANDAWKRAEDVAELESIFKPIAAQPVTPGHVGGPEKSRSGVAAKYLVRLKAFKDMSNEELEPFAKEMIEESYRPFTYIVQQGSHGDAMYFVMQGKVGVSTRGQVSESFLGALNIGETFGEMSLFDPGPRSADVRAENDVIVMKLSAEALQKVCRQAPAAAVKFLWSMVRMLSTRVRSMDKRAASAKDMQAAASAIH